MSERYLDPEWWEERRESRLRALGTRSPRCQHPGCAEDDPFALTGAGADILCAEHRALERGLPWIQLDHLAGQANDDAVVPLPANDHAVRSTIQDAWPRETLRNLDGSPLLRDAALARGWLDYLELVSNRAGAVPVSLERLDLWLREVLGPRWWDRFEQEDEE